MEGLQELPGVGKKLRKICLIRAVEGSARNAVSGCAQVVLRKRRVLTTLISLCCKENF